MNFIVETHCSLAPSQRTIRESITVQSVAVGVGKVSSSEEVWETRWRKETRCVDLKETCACVLGEVYG
jgi:hypothetical protein